LNIELFLVNMLPIQLTYVSGNYALSEIASY
jgi:hypothetical protein